MPYADRTSGYVRLGDWYIDKDESLDNLIIGDEEGLLRLRQAIDMALAQGESQDIDLDEFDGVRCLPKEFFWNAEEYEEPEGGGCSCLLILILAMVLLLALVVGLYTIITWIGARLL